MESSFGKNCRVTVFGGSHEDRIGVTLQGFPADFVPDLATLQTFMDRRAPGKSPFATSRKEPDLVHLQSLDPMTLYIENTDRKSGDYEQVRHVPRPGHADFTASVKYGDRLNMAGGGPFSGRMTAPLCIAGGLAMQVLDRYGVQVGAHINSIANISDQPFNTVNIPGSLLTQLSTSDFPVLSTAAGEKMQSLILEAKAQGDSVGGVVQACAINLPPGLGGPLYGGVESILSPILFAIPGVKGVSFGSGFESTTLLGSQNNDPFIIVDNQVRTLTNHHGGILGGITTGMPLVVQVGFKPTPSIAKEQRSVNLETMEPETIAITGRHDPCIVVRAVPVVEAALAIGLLDLLLEKEGAGQ